jgi:RimJ/RimL family protein N-acetyltransferase
MKKELIDLKESRLEDKIKAYEWLYFSDFPPNSAPYIRVTENKPSLEEFSENFKDQIFSGISPEKGRAFLITIKSTGEEIGFISYDSRHFLEGIAELDLWMKSTSYTGQGYGPAALSILSQQLFHKGFKKLITYTTNDNEHAIKAYKKAGFANSGSNSKEFFKPEFSGLAQGADAPDHLIFFSMSKS